MSSTPATEMPCVKPAPAPDKLNGYLDRLDADLATRTPSHRKRLLRRQHARWISLYEQWAGRIDSGLDPLGDETAFDFMLVLCELDRRLHALSRTD